MKKLGLGILIAVTVLAISGVAVAISNQGVEKGRAPDLEKIEFIHWKKDFAKPEGVGKPPKAPTCYKFLTGSKVKWIVPPAVSYVINPTNSGLKTSFVTAAISTSAETWDAVVTSKDLFNDEYNISTGAETAYGAQNYVNAISFSDRYSDPDIIAATLIWYNPATKAIVEFDITFETDYLWGNAGVTNETELGDTTVMDLQNIATHELGHGIGLGDVYEDVCKPVTMYGYSTEGETKKRTLETPDITGLQKLYGI